MQVQLVLIKFYRYIIFTVENQPLLFRDKVIWPSLDNTDNTTDIHPRFRDAAV